MPQDDHHRHDIDDRAWEIIGPLLPGRRGRRGGVAEDNRRFVNAVFWVLRTGAPWRGIATRHCKGPSSFVAAVQIRCPSLWLHIS